MRSCLTLTLVIFSALSAWGQKIETEYDHHANFQQYRTYTWGEIKLLTRQSKENEKLIEQAIVKAVDAELQSKGLHEDDNAPDLYVACRGGSAVADSKVGAAYAPHDLAGWGAGKVWTTNTIPGSVPNVWVTTQGVILFEMTDSKTDMVVWSSLLRKKIGEPGKMPRDPGKAAGDIARKAFREFPPSPSSR